MAAEPHVYETRSRSRETESRISVDSPIVSELVQASDDIVNPSTSSGHSSDVGNFVPSRNDAITSGSFVTAQSAPSLQSLVALGKDMGLAGPDLLTFVKDQQREEAARLEKEEERRRLEKEEERRLQREEAERREKEEERRFQREEAERERQERKEERDREFELQRLRLQNEGAAGNRNNSSRSDIDPDFDPRFVPKIPYLDDKDDIESWIHQYECYARDLKLDDETKATRLVYYLKGKARIIHSKLNDEDARDYDKIKAALFEGFQLTAEQYRVKFRTLRKEPQDSFKDHVAKLDRCLKKWIELDHCTKTVEGLTDLMLREQIIRTLPAELSIHVKDRHPRNAREMGEIATDYELNRAHVRNSQQNRNHRNGREGDKKDKPKEGNSQNDKNGSSQTSSREIERLRTAGLCFYCKSGTHRAKDCPQKKGTVCGAVQCSEVKENRPGSDKLFKLCAECTEIPRARQVHVKVDGRDTWAIRDTGCSSVVVARRLVRPEQFVPGYKKAKLADSTERDLHLAVVHLDSPYFVGMTEVIVMDKPCSPVIIGDNYGVTGERMTTPTFPVRDPEWYDEDAKEDCGAVTTRAGATQEAQDNSSVSKKDKERKPKEPEILGVTSPQELITAQQKDPTLDTARKQANSGEVKSGKKMVYKRGILYQSSLDKRGVETLRVVVPEKLRNRVLAYSHEHPMAGHMGQKRTEDRIRREFWWPGCAVDIRRYCLSCDVCQRTAPKHLTKKVPLGKMPIFDAAFKRVAVDIVGPIKPMSESKHQYVLTMIDYATRYPEAVALKNIKAETIADALWNFWTRLGIPETILSDNGSQFTGELMREVEHLLQIKHKVCAIFHPQANGLVERFHHTLKSMVRKLCIDQPQRWDTYLPAMLFAYREIPQESLGFSPFELLYGKTVRGPMQILRQIWTNEDTSVEQRTTAEYIVDLRNRIEETCKLARENLMKASKKQARYYNKKTKPRTLTVGTKVLVLRTTKHNKLELTWQGPYVVEEKINDYDYRIKIKDKGKIYHINLLKEYVERDSPSQQDKVAVVEEKDDDDTTNEEIISVVIEEDETMKEGFYDDNNQRDMPTFNAERKETVDHIHFSTTLTGEQVAEAKAICQEKARNLSDVPLTTNLMKCEVKLTTDTPVYVRPRPVPHALVENMEKEVDDMLKLGVIEPACSPYNSPIVMVKKKGGDYRFCADLRSLNDVVVADGEPLTDVQHLFQSLGKARFFSKLDLTKGYWAIPIEEEDKDKTAFTTSKGQFRWKNLPFGLKTASGIFNRMMRKLLGPLKRNDVHHFMDDILIATETWKEHMEALRAVLSRLEEANLAAKPSKVYIGYNQLPFLGHEIGNGQRWPEADKTEKITNAPLPTTKKELRSFLGLCSFYREYIDSFSSLAAPLTDLTKKDHPEKIVWNTEAERSFQELKTRISNRPVLIMPDHNKEFVLRTDASDRGLGAILLQEQDGKLHPIAYQSKKLLGAESRYAIVEKECLATVWGIQKFERFLYGKHFILETDHQPLKCLQKTPTNPRLTRWALQLQPYDFTIRVIKGKDNLGADFLSRTY